uniref:Uncharacterized protein n=1 Tax=Panagrolaimus sp. PS1159 TaxID=55785 RepID=A0AC35GER8_9BILA
MKRCCGFGKILYFTAMFISVILTVLSLIIPQWLINNKSDTLIKNIGLLDSDPYISGSLKSQWYFGAIAWSLIADCIAFFNFIAFGLACSRPTQCYLAMRRSSVISCYVVGQFSVCIVAFPIEFYSKNSNSNIDIGISYFLLCGAEAAALIGVVTGFVTSQIMYNALERRWDKRYYSQCSLCLPF